MSDLTTKAAEIRAGLVERLRDDRHCNDWYLRQEAAALIEQQAAELAEARAALQVAKDGWRDAEDAAKTLAAERDELLREKERLEAALKPFARAAADCDVVHDLRIGVVKPADIIWESAAAASITFGHLAAAQSALENGPAGLADANSKSPDPSSQSERIAVLCPHAPTYDAGLCCGHPDDCTFVSPAALAPLGEE